MNQSRTIRLPAHVVKELNVVLRALRHLETHAPPGGRDPSLEDVAHLLGKPVERRRASAATSEHMLSLDAPMDRESGLTIGDGIADEDARAPELVLHNSAIEAWVAAMARRAQRAPAHGDRAALRAQRMRRRHARGACRRDWASRASACARSRREALDKLRGKLERRGFTKDALF